MKKSKYPLQVIIPLCTALVCIITVFTHYFIPKIGCPFKAQWQIDCPGCGGTRAAIALSQADLSSAIRLNPLITTGIFLVSAYIIFSIFYRIIKKRTYQFPFSLTQAIILITIIITFTIVRNL